MTDVIVYYRSLAGLSRSDLAARWLQSLPYAKRQAVERAPEPAAIATLAGIDLLAQGAAALRGVGLDASVLKFPEGGKPAWPGGPAFSISHTAAWVACAVSATLTVGLDIENPARVRREILRRIASARELALHEARPQGLAVLWTRKEAVLKAAGASVFDAAAVAVDEAGAEFRGRRWYFGGADALEGCAMALATERPGTDVDLRLAVQLA
ncbi:MAG TPA: 4'-phosphopantetheinyl transferase superfamily protein [Steroidobacteraceae bacterium]|nr:4'-phosphopantetheinyl transferase superfamily protein [Steroidobacteraceae bacterium]